MTTGRAIVNIDDIAMVCHEANRAFCDSIGDTTQLPWETAPQWQRDSAINGVKFHLSTPDARADASHNSWMAEKVNSGWVYGEIKDVEKKTHPCIVPYEELPKQQQVKDYIFRGIVHSFIDSGIEINND